MNKKWTGERLETFIYGDTAVEHLHRYAVSSLFVNDKIVLDIASGEGYGTSLLSKTARQIIGVDIDGITVEMAAEKYKGTNLKFLVGSADKIPVEDNTIDVLVSFETIEHHDKHNEMMLEIKRVLKPNGIMIMSSPDKKHYIQLGKDNHFHIKELYLEEFEILVSNYFKNTKTYFQKCINGSSVISSVSDFRKINLVSGDYSKIYSKEFEPLYNIIIASNDSIEEVGLSIFDGEIITDQLHEDEIRYIRKSTSFRLGNLILFPIIKLKSMFKKLSK